MSNKLKFDPERRHDSNKISTVVFVIMLIIFFGLVAFFYGLVTNEKNADNDQGNLGNNMSSGGVWGNVDKPNDIDDSVAAENEDGNTIKIIPTPEKPIQSEPEPEPEPQENLSESTSVESQDDSEESSAEVENNQDESEENSSENTSSESATVEDENYIVQPSENTGEKLVAITFDDGPTNNTDRVLEMLERYNAKATFFLIGVNISAKQQQVTNIYNAGHQIGNHTYNHSNLVKFGTNGIINEINSTDNLIASITGQRPTSMRPPFGSYNESVANVLASTGHSVIMWDIDPRDWDVKNTATVTNHVLERVQDGSIILLHDFYDTSVDAAENILSTLSAQGYKFVTVDELLTRHGNPIQSGGTYRGCYPAQ